MKIKRFFVKILILLMLINVENNLEASSQNKIIVKVENQIISSYELRNKIKITLFLSNQELNQKNINFTKDRAIRQLIEYKLKKNEILQTNHKIINESQVNDYFKNLSSKYKTDIYGIKKIFKNNELDFDLYFDEIKTEFDWQSLIFKKFGNRIKLDENEVNNELNLYLKTQNNLKEYKLAEIEISLKNTQDDKNTFFEINKHISEQGFEKTAKKYSISTSALDGGNIGWISSKSLSDEILIILDNMKVGEISKPIIQTNSGTILKLLQTKKTSADSLNMNDLKQKIINNKKNQLLNLYSNNHLSKIKNNALIEIK